MGGGHGSGGKDEGDVVGAEDADDAGVVPVGVVVSIAMSLVDDKTIDPESSEQLAEPFGHGLIDADDDNAAEGEGAAFPDAVVDRVMNALFCEELTGFAYESVEGLDDDGTAGVLDEARKHVGHRLAAACAGDDEHVVVFVKQGFDPPALKLRAELGFGILGTQAERLHGHVSSTHRSDIYLGREFAGKNGLDLKRSGGGIEGTLLLVKSL